MGQCKKCGNELNDNQKFCNNCGEKNENYIEEIASVESEAKNNVTESKEKNKNVIIASVVIAIIAIIVIIVVIVIPKGEDSSESGSKAVTFKSIYNELDDSYYVTLASDNSYLKIDTNPLNLDDFSSSEAWELVEKTNRKLKLPESIDEKMQHTRAMDGRISETYKNITVSWTYHPDKGLEIIYEKK